MKLIQVISIQMLIIPCLSIFHAVAFSEELNTKINLVFTTKVDTSLNFAVSKLVEQVVDRNIVGLSEYFGPLGEYVNKRIYDSTYHVRPGAPSIYDFFSTKNSVHVLVEFYPIEIFKKQYVRLYFYESDDIDLTLPIAKKYYPLWNIKYITTFFVKDGNKWKPESALFDIETDIFSED